MLLLATKLNLPERFYDQIIREVSARPEVQRVILFGSRARGDHQERSDIDLAIAAPTATHSQWAQLHWELTEEADTLLEVDVVRLEEVEPRLQERILRDGKVIHDRGASTGQS